MIDRRALLSGTPAVLVVPLVLDALRTGLVASLARPGGSVTGRSVALVDLAGKTVELLRETLPRAARFACLVHREDPLHREFFGARWSSPRSRSDGSSPAGD